MPDEPAAPVVETPRDEAPVSTDTPPEQQPDTNAEEATYKQRYENLQPEYTRASQEAAQSRELIEALRSDDPQLRTQALEAIGLEFDEPEPEPLDDVEELRQKLSDLDAWRQEQTQVQQTNAQREAEIGYMDEQFDALEKQSGQEFTDDDIELVGRLAQQMRDDKGRPDVSGAHARLQAYLDVATPRRVATKKAAQVQAGAQGAKELDFSDKRARRQAMADRMAAENAE